MSAMPRLNGVIGALEHGGTAFVSWSTPEVESVMSLGGSAYDGLVIDSEHFPWDSRTLRDCLQYLLDRGQIATTGSITPKVTPLIRISANGEEKNQYLAKQALDIGSYGVVWPHISTVDQAYNAVAACRYPRLPSAPRFEPAGIRGDGPLSAARYWGTSPTEYYERADVWPLDPEGEVLVILQCEDVAGIENLPDILKNVPGIGVILIGEGDLSQELGHPREYEHPEVLSAVAEIVSICTANGVVVGHPHAELANTQRLVEEGFRFLMSSPSRSYERLDLGRKLTGRS
jgi:4-hydroxy-2-oxoheptanedioate aldolase